MADQLALELGKSLSHVEIAFTFLTMDCRILGGANGKPMTRWDKLLGQKMFIAFYYRIV